MPVATMTSKGQVTIPKDVREHLGLRPGDQINFEYSGDTVRIVARKRSIESLRGIFKQPGQKAPSIREMDDAIAEAAVQRYLRSTSPSSK